MWILIVLVNLAAVLFTLGLLKRSHRIRYVNGYDMELESDYKAIVEQTRKREKQMGYVIFSFEDGEYLCDNQGQLLTFESRGLAYQYMQINYHSPLPIQKTKRIIHYPNFYQAPFKVHKVCQGEY